eukprot:jgi/Botrbrau1/4535/Bobra.60_2s0023.1
MGCTCEMFFDRPYVNGLAPLELAELRIIVARRVVKVEELMYKYWRSKALQDYVTLQLSTLSSCLLLAVSG